MSGQELGHLNPLNTLLHCGNLLCLNTPVRSVPCIITSLRYTLPYYSVELYPKLIHCSTSKHCWGISNANTMLRYIQPLTLLRHILSYYIGELFPIFEHCWCIPCLIKLLRGSQSWKIFDVYPVSVRCWAIPYRKILPMCTLSHYIAELLPILKCF